MKGHAAADRRSLGRLLLWDWVLEFEQFPTKQSHPKMPGHVILYMGPKMNPYFENRSAWTGPRRLANSSTEHPSCKVVG